MKRLANATEAQIISDIKPCVREGDKSRGAQTRICLGTHNGICLAQPRAVSAPWAAPSSHAPNTVGADTGAPTCRYLQLHTDTHKSH